MRDTARDTNSRTVTHTMPRVTRCATSYLSPMYKRVALVQVEEHSEHGSRLDPNPNASPQEAVWTHRTQTTAPTLFFADPSQATRR